MPCDPSCRRFRAGVVCSQLCRADSLLLFPHIPQRPFPGRRAVLLPWQRVTASLSAPWKVPSRHKLEPAQCLCGSDQATRAGRQGSCERY